MNAEEDQPPGPQSHSGGSLEDQNPESPKQTKSRSGPVFLHLPRCASCYNHKARIRRDLDGESSSSAEDSGPDVDSESEAESSSSSSSCSGNDSCEILELPEADETAEPESEVLSKKQDENPLYVMKQRLQALATTEEIYGEGGRIRNPPYPQVSLMHQDRLSWSQRSLPSLQQPQLHLPQLPQQQQPTLKLSFQHQQQQQHQLCDPLSAQGQMLPPPPLTLPVSQPQPFHPTPRTQNTPQMHALFPQSCWHCSHMQFPYT